MKDIIKIVKSIEDSRLLLEGVSERIQSETKEQKGGILRCCLVHWVLVYYEIF